jgi:predicted AlkP superfamily pyrophosphatase or phosphodiesterase
VKKLLALAIAVSSLVAVSLTAQQQPAATDPRLILLIAVDQFRYDYLTRFRNEYKAGFNRLLTKGAVFTDANLEHYPTVTAIGHSTMLSGATPSISGIIGNDWYDRATGKTVTSVSDESATLVGAPGSGASPHRYLVTTVGDQLKMAVVSARGTDAAPRVIGMSLKDRSAILPAGHAADAAYWWDQKSGNFVTSTYYMKALPAWVEAFNGRRMPDSWAGKVLTLLSPPPDTHPRQLPAEPGAPLYQGIYSSPYGNDLLAAFAMEGLEKEKLGQRGVTDLLSVSFSSNDAVGHTYGPDSPEVHDIAVRTDEVIGRLLTRVDQLVGLQHVIVALTADHGVSPVPEVLTQASIPAGRMTQQQLFGPIEQALAARFGGTKWIASTAGTSPYFDYGVAAAQKADLAEVRKVAARAAAAIPHVARVYTRDDLARGIVTEDRIGRRIIRGFNLERSGDLEIVLEPNWMRQSQGTTHGTPYNYDAHIPLILMGPRITPGEYSDAVALNDLAPTLATLAHVEVPSGSVGRVLTEAIKDAPVRQEQPSR